MPKVIVGLTGGIGTGKTAALRAFERGGAATISSDAIAHELSRPGRPVYRNIVRAFGRRFLDKSGRIDRKALGAAVFRDAKLRRRLERATHPAILGELERRVRASRGHVVVVDVPLLFEAKLQDRFHVTVVVTAPARLASRRVVRRDGCTRAQVQRVMSAQWPIGRKEKLADVVVPNTGTLKGLEGTIKEYCQAFRLMGQN